jgi:hypothetical protein
MDPYIVKAAWLIRWYSSSSSAYIELSLSDLKMLMDAALNENPNANRQVFRPIIPLKVRPAGLLEGFAT